MARPAPKRGDEKARGLRTVSAQRSDVVGDAPPVETGGGHGDPRVYMAAERTFLAWIRTAIALMAFGFVIARFNVLLRRMAGPAAPETGHGSGYALALGLSLIAVGVLVCVVSAAQYRRYVGAIDRGRSGAVVGAGLGFGVAALLVLAGLGIAFYLLSF